jgi:hypothetical protein
MNLPRRTKTILLIAVCLCFLCALFPPRCITNAPSFPFVIRDGRVAPFHVTHDFLFDPDFGTYESERGTFMAVVDGGRLLAELVLIACLTVILVAFLRMVD